MIHFKPLELYPPAINLISYFGQHGEKQLLVLTTVLSGQQLKEFDPGMPNIHIKRFAAIKQHSLWRLWHYLQFYAGALMILLKYKPVSVLYFETISSWPALMYKKIRKGQTQLMVHYHEYNSPVEYHSGMRLVKEMYRMEKKMYSNSFDWISHTNEIRLADFKKDNALNNLEKNIFHAMPNYPSKYWGSVQSKSVDENNTRLVYLGALGFDNMYIRETLEWVKSNDCLTLDIYANVMDDKASSYIHEFECSRINYHGSISYPEIPGMLKKYDVGLVIYKPFNENTVNAVSNKVFEYLACGLDVWFSQDMTYTLKYSRLNAYPKVVPVDFNRLAEFNYREQLDRKNIPYQATAYYYENVYPEIYAKMVNSYE